MKKLIFICSAVLIFIGLITFIGCQKEDNSNEPEAMENSMAPGCDLNYGVQGFVVQKDGVINFRDAKKLNDFLKSKPRLNNGEFKAWEASVGAKTAFGLSIEVEDKLGVLLTRHEKDPKMTEATFKPIFEQFSQQYGHLARISAEGVEPLFSPPFCYFANKDGIYRICGQEYLVNGTLLFSYPVGRQDLVTKWNGDIGVFGELIVQELMQKRTEEKIIERSYSDDCTAVFNNNKRIKVERNSKFWTIYDPINLPGLVQYSWHHDALVKAQSRSLGIWWRDTRHISLEITGSVTNFHAHPSINWSLTHNLNFFYCTRTDRITEVFAADSFVHWIDSPLLGYNANFLTTGTNRQDDCIFIQAQCTLVN